MCIIGILSAAGCLSLNYSTPQSVETQSIDTLSEIVLIQSVEIIAVEAGETITVPDIDGVTYWYLMSDYAMEKINKLQIDRSRVQDYE